MPKLKKGNEIKNIILTKYYSEIYHKYLFGKSLQSTGINCIERAIENFWNVKTPKNVLELGGGSGEHLKFLRYTPMEKYVSLDIQETLTSKRIENISPEFLRKLDFVTGDAQEIPFKDSTFDRVFSTCLLHHVDDVLQVLLETRRVTTTGGEIAFLLPTDPGMLNQFIKKYISYPKLKKLTNIRPGLFYALEHKNHVGGILELIRFVFQNDNLKFHYRPFGVRSWNLNLYIVAKIVKLDEKVSLRELII